MKSRITMLQLAFLLIGTSTLPAQQDLGAKIKAANEELLNQGNVARVAAIFAPAYVVHGTTGDMKGGPEVIAGFVKGLRTAFPDLHVQVEILASQGNRVTWIRTHSGTQQADYMGVPASHRVVKWRDMVVTRFDGGKVAEEWAVSDLGERLRVP